MKDQLMGFYVLGNPAAQQAKEKLVQLFNFPVTVHVGFSQSQIALGKSPFDDTGSEQLNVPGASAVDGDISLFQKFGDQLVQAGLFGREILAMKGGQILGHNNLLSYINKLTREASKVIRILLIQCN